MPPPAPPPVVARAGTPRKTAETGSDSPETRAAPLTMKTEVGVFDFSAVHDPKLNRVQVRFIIKNINRNISVIEGLYLCSDENGRP